MLIPLRTPVLTAVMLLSACGGSGSGSNASGTASVTAEATEEVTEEVTEETTGEAQAANAHLMLAQHGTLKITATRSHDNRRHTFELTPAESEQAVFPCSRSVCI